MQPLRSRCPFAAALAALLLASVLTTGLLGCDAGKVTKPADTPPAPSSPPPIVVLTPESTVSSYLHLISLAYRVGDSAIASPTYSPYEEVRVNSYVQYNKQEGRLIDQRLTLLKVKSVTSQDGTATVAVHEEWTYRYISSKTGKYSGPQREVSYESTYTVVKQADGTWRVDRVQATPNKDVE